MSAVLPDFTPFFSHYEALAREADSVFEHVRSQFPAEVVCMEGCSSCCHALFDLSLIEALYLNHRFLEMFPAGMDRFQITERASDIDRKITKAKRKIFQESRDGKDTDAILGEAAALRFRCPLLGDDDRCIMYAYRPVTCRFYGIPTSIGGKGHTCGKTGFMQGQKYPTVFLDKVQTRLAELSADITASLGSAYSQLDSMYVPVSSALITTYNAEYLGIGGIPKEEDE